MSPEYMAVEGVGEGRGGGAGDVGERRDGGAEGAEAAGGEEVGGEVVPEYTDLVPAAAGSRGESNGVATSGAPALENETNRRGAGENGEGGNFVYRRGEEDGALAPPPTKKKKKAPAAMGDEEVRRINEERRLRMKAGGFTNFVLRWRGRGKGKGKRGGKEGKEGREGKKGERVVS